LTPRRAAALLPLALLALLLLAGPASAQVQLDSAGPGTEAGLWLARLVNHVSLAAVVGLLLVPAWLLGDTAAPAMSRRASRLAAVAASIWALSAVAIFVFGLSNAAARPLPEALDPVLLSRFAGTRLGSSLAVQATAALVVAGLAATARDRVTAAVALVGALLGAAGPAWWGHAGTADPLAVAVVSTWLHVAAASLWVGGLLAVTVLVLGSSTSMAPLPLTLRFSAVAGWAVVAVGLTGILNTVLQTSAVTQLADTTWGRMAVAKALLLIGLAAFGWVHRRRSIPRLRTAGAGGAARRLFVRIAVVELVIMLGSMALATTMASGMPAEAEAAARIQTFTAPLGEGVVEVTLDPAVAGRANEAHVYVYDADGALLPFDDAELELRSGEVALTPRLLDSGPGHVTGPAVELPAAGAYVVIVRVTVDGEVDEGRGALTVR
jgi:copper transport protein